MLPDPKVSFLLPASGTNQHWGYFGGEFAGGTWACDRVSGLGERLTYWERRLVVGWKPMRPRPRGTFRASGTSLHAESGSPTPFKMVRSCDKRMETESRCFINRLPCYNFLITSLCRSQ